MSFSSTIDRVPLITPLLMVCACGAYPLSDSSSTDEPLDQGPSTSEEQNDSTTSPLDGPTTGELESSGEETEGPTNGCMPESEPTPRGDCETCVCNYFNWLCVPLECPPPGVPSLQGRYLLSESTEGFSLDSGTKLELLFDLSLEYPPELIEVQQPATGLVMFAGCNTISTLGYSLQHGRLTLDPGITTTLVACASDQDNRFLDFLFSAPSYEFNDTQLTLTHDEITLVFNDSEFVDRPLEWTYWDIDALSSTTIDFTEASHPHRLFFHPSTSSLTVSTTIDVEQADQPPSWKSCDDILSYQQDDDQLLIDPVVDNSGPCTTPELAEQLETIRRFLVDGPLTVTINTTSLILTNKANATMTLSTDRYVRD